ncbi:relaxase/mobilization nuclease domain-containing protein [Ruminococcus sp.]|uniref:relaxase/mobilization nuclease domain-containing protein n=1 Tax=Ruminococcus sp. TaxID=41978 RepID=UPI002FA7166A
MAYITRDDKTIDGLYVNSYACRADSAGASEDFRAVRNTGTGRSQILAYHMIQSFAPSEVTPEQAMQIGEELCDRYLKGDYQYVIAVHNDKDHLHCHVIFNNTNLYNGLSFTTEHNQGRKSERAWAELREISDEICAEHGISVISEPEKGHGVSHFERDMQKEGKSWKDKLRVRIAEVMLYSRDFKDFLEKCSECGIEYVYKPSNKVKLKFRLSGDGQQKFTRADTLGADFTPERIAEQIAEIQEKLSAANVTPDMLIEPPKPVVPKTEPKPTQTVTVQTKPKQSAEPETITETSETAKRKAAAEQVEKFFAARRARRQAQLDMLNATAAKPTEPKPEPSAPTPQPTPTESKAPEKKIDEWATIRGMRDSDKIIAELEAVGIMSLSEFGGFMHNIHSPEDHTDEVAALKAQYTAIDKLLAMMKQRSDNSATYKEYQERSAFTQKHFRKKNAAAIDAYEEADKYITEHIKAFYVDGKAPKRSELAALSKQLKDKCKAIMPEHKAYLLKHETAMRYTRQVRQYLNEQYMKREREKSRQRTQAKHRNKNTLE